MEADKEKWIEGIFSSLEGAERAQPPAALWDRIEASVGEGDAVRKPKWQRGIAVAAAVMLLAVNLLAVRHLQNSTAFGSGNSELQASGESYDHSLISGYNLYE